MKRLGPTGTNRFQMLPDLVLTPFSMQNKIRTIIGDQSANIKSKTMENEHVCANP